MSDWEGVLERLYATIASRKTADPGSSYTAKLLHQGRSVIAKKMGEEAVETAIARSATTATPWSPRAPTSSITCWCGGPIAGSSPTKCGRSWRRAKAPRAWPRRRHGPRLERDLIET